MILDIPLSAFAPVAIVVAILLFLADARETPLLRQLVSAGMILVIIRYVMWRASETLDGPGIDWADRIFIHVLFAIELIAMFDAIILLVMMSRRRDNTPEADRHEARLRALPASALPAVDVLIATYNEPLEVLERTILCARAIDWPDLRVWVCDDGRRAWLKAYCERQGVGYLTRPDNRGAKAGNLNAALARTSAPFILVLDADFAPRRHILYRMIGFFDDPRVAILQTPQFFYNPDPLQQNLGLHRLLPNMERLWYDAILPCRDAWDAAFWCGTNSVLRRSALAAIGGKLAEDSVTEDLMTSLALLRQGYVTRYLGETLALGLAPESMAGIFVQRIRWSRGGIQTLYLRHGPLGPGLTLRHRLFFLPTFWLSISLVQLTAVLAPLIFMWTGLIPIANLTVVEVVYYQLPLIISQLAGLKWLSRGVFHAMQSEIVAFFLCVRLTPSVIWTFLRPFGHAFKVTPKGRDAREADREPLMQRVAFALTLATLGGIVINLFPDTRRVDITALIPVVVAWALYNAIMINLAWVMASGRPQLRAEERFDMDGEPAELTANGEDQRVALIDLSLAGALVAGASGLTAGSLVTLRLRNVPPLECRVVRQRDDRLGLMFLSVDDVAREALILRLMSEQHTPSVVPVRAEGIARHMLARLWAG